jgi:hypothetical protein
LRRKEGKKVGENGDEDQVRKWERERKEQEQEYRKEMNCKCLRQNNIVL